VHLVYDAHTMPKPDLLPGVLQVAHDLGVELHFR